MDKILHYLSEEPVRVYLYTVAVALVTVLVAVGVITGGVVPLILALVSAILAVPGTESLRSRVTPWRPED